MILSDILYGHCHYLIPNGSYAIIQNLHSGGLWGVESDSGKDYLESIENEQIDELKDYCRKMNIEIPSNVEIIESEKKLQEKAIWWIQTEVETYDDYISGQVYRYSIENSEEEEDDLGCGGWYEDNHEKSGLLSEARAEIDHLIERRIKEAIRDTEEQIEIY